MFKVRTKYDEMGDLLVEGNKGDGGWNCYFNTKCGKS